jgi:hypothetical protein
MYMNLIRKYRYQGRRRAPLATVPATGLRRLLLALR